MMVLATRQLGVAEGQRQLRGRQAVLARQRVVAARGHQRLGPAPALLAHRFELRHAAWLRAPRAVDAGGVVLAGQQAKAQRRIGQQRHAQRCRFRPGRCPRAVDQAVGVLHAGHARQAVLFGQAHELVHAIGRFIGQADVAHLAGLDQRPGPPAARGWRFAACPWPGRNTAMPKAGTWRSGQWIWYRSITSVCSRRRLASQEATMSAAVRSHRPRGSRACRATGRPPWWPAPPSGARRGLANQLPMMVSVAPQVSAAPAPRTSRRCR
jgi:hypothetical protein